MKPRVPGDAPRKEKRAAWQKPAWAIQTGDGAFIGVYWFGHDHVRYMDPFRIASWSSRADARAALPHVKGPRDRGRYPRARVVRVLISVVEKP